MILVRNLPEPYSHENIVFRIITREMDSLPQLRPDNNY